MFMDQNRLINKTTYFIMQSEDGSNIPVDWTSDKCEADKLLYKYEKLYPKINFWISRWT
jgi:hypothetical protein